MHSFKKFFNHIQSNYSFKTLEYASLVLISVSIFVVSSFGLYRPVSDEHYLHVLRLANQELLEETHAMANQLLAADRIRNIDYFRLMNAKQFEAAKIKKYPPLNIDNIQ